MKIWINQTPSDTAGGVQTVVRQQYEYLPKYGVEIVDTIEEADVVHCHISTFGVNTNKPLVVSSHGMLWQEHGWGRLGDKINKECLESYRRADIVTAPSEFVARAIGRYTLAQPLIVRHGIDTAGIPKRIKHEKYVVWNKARIDPANNPDEMNKLAELALDISFFSTFGKQTSNVTITGLLPYDDMLSLVANAGIYLDTPLESGAPCFGVLEAMAYGVPILAWDFGGNAEAIKHLETGYLAKPYDYEDLLNGLYWCLNNRLILADNVITAVKEFNIEQSMYGYIEAYELALYNDYTTDVTVVVPCYNLGKFLPHCLDSVLSQDGNFDVVVVDDASNDNTKEIIEDYIDKYPDIVTGVFNHTNKHVSASRNIGAGYGEGRYLLPLDADDRLAPDAIQKMVNYLDNHHETDIVAGRLLVFHESDLSGNSIQSGWPNDTDLVKQLEGYNRLPYASMYRRKVFNRVGGYRTRIKNGIEDADFWTRALSYGYKAHLLDDITLHYTHREKSLGKTNENGADAWLAWFGWDYKTSPAISTKVHSFYPPAISVVIPVGPGHVPYLQACLDSLVAQNYHNFEVVVVNDTGSPWYGPPIRGASFIKVVDTYHNQGPAFARNLGVEHALADKIVFLDVDDTAQPDMLEILLKAHELVGGWVYGDWYKVVGSNTEYSEAKDWTIKGLINQSLAPITGIYEKKHIQLVGGFDENAPGWEDWDFQLKLLAKGICGTRVAYPLIAYNMLLGNKRERDFKNKKDLIQYISEKHDNLRRRSVACSGGCGGKATVVVQQANYKVDAPDTIMLEYLGNESRQRFNSPSRKGVVYQTNKNRRQTLIFKDDLPWALNKRNADGSVMFRVPEEVKTVQTNETVLVSQDIPVPTETFESLGFDTTVANLLKAHYDEPAQVRQAADGTLLAIKGIGKSRLAEIRSVLA